MTDIQIRAKVVVIKDGKVLVLKRSSTAPFRALQWELPGGALENNENIEYAADRELSEETGIMCKTRLIYATTEWREWQENGKKNEANFIFTFFLAVPESDFVRLSYEHSDYKWVDLEEALRLITYKTQHDALKYIMEKNLC